MPAVGMIFAWFGYSVASWGWILIKGWDVTFGQWLDPVHRYSGPWPPPYIPDGYVLPPGATSGKEPAGDIQGQT
jgi:hypothetical protein